MFTACLLAMTLAADPFKFTPKDDEDRITAKVEKDRTLIDITSATGIGELTVERTGETWPETLVVRLHLNGLEMFRADSGKVSLAGEVLSHTDYKVMLTVEGKKENPKDPKSPYYMDFKMVGKDGKPATVVPLRGGYFDVTLPKPFFEGNPKTVALRWIDFYRR